MKGRKRNKHKK